MDTEPSDRSRKHVWIGAGAAVGFFLFFFFGEIFFMLPRVFVIDLFGYTVGESRNAVSAQDFWNNMGDDRAPTRVGIDEIEEHLVPPVSPELAESVGILDFIEGDGAAAEEGSRVSVGYTGTYIEEGTGERVTFDSNTDPETPFSFTIGDGSVIPGFSGGIVGMREGGHRLIRIEPSAGYGDRTVGSIPPNTTLFFVIELYAVE